MFLEIGGTTIDAGTMDEDVFTALENKRVSQDDLLNALKARLEIIGAA